VRLLNLTGEKLRIVVDLTKADHILYPTSVTASVTDMAPTDLGDADGIPVRRAPRAIVGLPDPQDGVGYIVNPVVFHLTDREDVFKPGPDQLRGTGETEWAHMGLIAH
jgi:hypothetical protein